jgi:hypothetical protein
MGYKKEMLVIAARIFGNKAKRQFISSTLCEDKAAVSKQINLIHKRNEQRTNIPLHRPPLAARQGVV